MITSTQLVEYCKKQVNEKTVYMWGTFGHTVTPSLVYAKRKQYPNMYTPDVVNNLYKLYGQNVRAWDCVGLIKSAVWSDYKPGNTKGYDPTQDVGADAAYNMAKVKGDISTLPERPGVILHMKGHVGVYIGNGEVIECTPAWKNGVQKTQLSQRKWLHWFNFPFVEYPVESVDNSVKPGDVYQKMEDIPQGEFRDVVSKLIERNVIRGENGKLNLSGDMVRILVYLSRMEVI